MTEKKRPHYSVNEQKTILLYLAQNGHSDCIVKDAAKSVGLDRVPAVKTIRSDWIPKHYSYVQELQDAGMCGLNEWLRNARVRGCGTAESAFGIFWRPFRTFYQDQDGALPLPSSRFTDEESALRPVLFRMTSFLQYLLPNENKRNIAALAGELKRAPCSRQSAALFMDGPRLKPETAKLLCAILARMTPRQRKSLTQGFAQSLSSNCLRLTEKEKTALSFMLASAQKTEQLGMLDEFSKTLLETVLLNGDKQCYAYDEDICDMLDRAGLPVRYVNEIVRQILLTGIYSASSIQALCQLARRDQDPNPLAEHAYGELLMQKVVKTDEAPNYGMALTCFKRAAMMNVPLGYYDAALLIARGTALHCEVSGDMACSHKQAYEMAMNGVQHGSAACCWLIASASSRGVTELISDNPAFTEDYYRRAINGGLKNAYISLGQFFESRAAKASGSKDRLGLYRQALECYKNSAPGVCRSWSQMGMLYETGRGVARDDKMAAQCFLKAVEGFPFYIDAESYYHAGRVRAGLVCAEPMFIQYSDAIRFLLLACRKSNPSELFNSLSILLSVLFSHADSFTSTEKNTFMQQANAYTQSYMAQCNFCSDADAKEKCRSLSELLKCCAAQYKKVFVPYSAATV